MTQLYAQAALAIAGHWLQHGSIPPGDPQDEALTRYYPKPTQQAQTVDWHTMTAAQIHALVRLKPELLQTALFAQEPRLEPIYRCNDAHQLRKIVNIRSANAG